MNAAGRSEGVAPGGGGGGGSGRRLRPLHVSHGVLEQHQVERGVDLVVALHHLRQGGVQAGPGLHGQVAGLPLAPGEVAVQVEVPGLLQGLLSVLHRGGGNRPATHYWCPDPPMWGNKCTEKNTTQPQQQQPQSLHANGTHIRTNTDTQTHACSSPDTQTHTRTHTPRMQPTIVRPPNRTHNDPHPHKVNTLPKSKNTNA